MLRIKKSSKSSASSRNGGGSVISSGSNATNPFYHYVRPYTPSIDYTPTVDYSDAMSRELQINQEVELQMSHAPSEFSVESFNRSREMKTPVESERARTATPETASTNDGRDSSPSQDSGISEMNVQILDKDELGASCAELCRELRTVTTLSQDFLEDAVLERESAADLLHELDAKIRPFLITLDEELSQQEVTLRKNIDKCRVSEARVNWLLRYNGFTLEFRKILTSLANEIYDELEHFLRLRSRGCLGLTVKRDMNTQLTRMTRILNHVDEGVRHERSLPEAAYA